MPLVEDHIATPFGAGYARLSGACAGLRLVRRTLDQSQLDLTAEEQVDQVELVQAILEHGAMLEDHVVFTVGFDAPAASNGDQATWSLDFYVKDGGVSLSVLDDDALEERRGVTLIDPLAELNASLRKDKLTFVQAVETGRRPNNPVAIEPQFDLQIGVSPPGGFLTAAFAWKRADGFSHETDSSVYGAAERAAFKLG